MNRWNLPLILGSASPRRLDLLRAAGFNPKVQVSDIDESVLPAESPESYVERLAISKAHAIEEESVSIVAGDTIVVLDGKILGKPASSDEAIHVLGQLSGREHRIVGGWCVRGSGEYYSGVEECRVWFRELSEVEIFEYVNTGEPMDKAGSYAIQGGAGRFVTRFEGYWSNAVGLALIPVVSHLEKFARR
ncbi:MAG: septum formation protein Maf [Proteobacteria bacterium]|jgi:septum formation protein|nr:septum formation protein Maf [Planctomycetia bacterium]NCG55896.1 septum formation protein Maf [Pseudomonadota bacterium]